MKPNSPTPVAAVYDRRKSNPGSIRAPACPNRRLRRLVSATISFVFIAFFVAISASAQIQQAWVARYNNGMPNGTHQAVKMTLDTNGNIYVTGFSQNTNGHLGYATIKYAPSGNQMWAARYDSTNYPAAQPTAMALDHQSNIVVTGTAVTVKYDSNGNQLWTLSYSGKGVATDSSNNVCVTGISSNYTTMKFSPAGSNLWTQTFTAQGPCGAQTINIGASDDIYVCGYYFYDYMPFSHFSRSIAFKYDSSGAQLWTVNSGGTGTQGYITIPDAKVDNTGSYYFAFNSTTPGTGNTDTTYAYSDAGGLLWAANNPTGNLASLALGLVLDSSNNVFVTGKIHDNFDNNTGYGTYKINTNGGYLWTNDYPTIPTSTNVATAIMVDTANSVYVTGYSPGTNSGNDIVTIKYDNNGNQLWLQRYNGPGNGDDEANAIAVDAGGNVYVTGFETVAGGGTEMVTIKYAPGPFLKKQANGSFLLQAAGAAGESFDFQASTNLQTWQDLGTNLADTNGQVQFLDTNASLFPHRFYLTNPQPTN